MVTHIATPVRVQVLHALSVLGPQALAASAARVQAGEKLRQQLAQVLSGVDGREWDGGKSVSIDA